MKKLTFLSLVVTVFIAFSCSKDAKINRRLDGSWKVVSYNGVAVSGNNSETYTFNKTKKKEGTGILETVDGGFTVSIPFTYKIEDEKISITITFSGLLTETAILTVTKYKKDHMEFVDSSGGLTVLEPK